MDGGTWGNSERRYGGTGAPSALSPNAWGGGVAVRIGYGEALMDMIVGRGKAAKPGYGEACVNLRE